MRRPVPKVDSLNLLDVLDKYVRTKGVKAAVFFGPYAHIGRTQAAYAPGLAFNFDILEALLSVAPAGEVKSRVLKGHLMTLQAKYDGLSNNSPFSKDLWSGHRADIISTMLCHLRRVRQDTIRARQMQHTATDADVLAVDKLCMLLELTDASAFEGSSPRDDTLSLPGSRACSRASYPGRDTCYYPVMARNLKREVSLDADGYLIFCLTV